MVNVMEQSAVNARGKNDYNSSTDSEGYDAFCNMGQRDFCQKHAA
jgi:hypothetical protein